MDLLLDGIHATLERPATRKFTCSLVILPELFTTISHLSLLSGYLVSLGWEVYALDLHTARSPDRPLTECVAATLAALEQPAVLLGHGLGGTIALRLAQHTPVRASVALAPTPPAFASPLWSGWRNRVATRMGKELRPPVGRLLFEFVADADPFQRESLIKNLHPAASGVIRNLDQYTCTPLTVGKPRAIVCGDSDIFAPLSLIERMATDLGVELVKLPGRGHWLIGGRALERTVQAAQRFLVKALGSDLLLLYPEDT
jgi:pimeloyl-ACP methyl ester carboxylesterase